MIDADGTDLRRVTTPPLGTSDTEPRFSPDGKKLLFTRFRGGGHFLESGRVVGDTSALFTVDVDGSNLQRISGWGLHVGQADWSPDGTRIVFETACCRLGAAGIYTVDAQGGHLTAIVNGRGVSGIGNEQALQVDGYYDPVWSPDGTRILPDTKFLADDGTFTVGLVHIDPDNGHVEWASSTVHEEHQPDWGSAPLQ